MKKNVMMRVASIMLVLVLMSSSVISGTFAKYVTADTGADNARVAKFGVVITEKFDGLFLEDYSTHDAWTGDTDKYSVVSSETDVNVVAPGTNGALTDFEVTGTPEVDVAVTYTADLVLTGWKYNKAEYPATDYANYCPVVITVNGTAYYVGKDDITNSAELETAVEAAIVASTQKYNAGTDLGTVVADDLSVSWIWNFEGVNHPTAGYQTDVKDTALGNWALNNELAPEISLTVTCTVTQID